MDYILGRVEKETGCIFDLDMAHSFSRRYLMLYRDEMVVILLNRYPYANGHLLVAPARHVGDICDLTEAENNALIQKVQQSVVILRRHLQPDGLNIGLNLGEVAGAGLADHLHYHIVPRWRDDHNFMTVIAEIRSIPDHLENTFDLLVDDFQKLLLT
jgi:ATP adenylyltransferase